MSEPTTMRVREPEQPDHFQTGVYRDQHGRKFAGVLNKNTGTPVGHLNPFGWSPPLPTMIPPDKFRRYRPEEREFVIDYDAWADEYKQAAAEFQDYQLQVAQKFYGAAALDKIKDGDTKLRQLTGDPPQDLLFLAAMKRGHPWALGLSSERPEWADRAWDSWNVRTVVAQGGSALDAYDDILGAETQDSAPVWSPDDETELFADAEPVAASGRRARRGN
jgi:hypothetical protein